MQLTSEKLLTKLEDDTAHRGSVLGDIEVNVLSLREGIS